MPKIVFTHDENNQPVVSVEGAKGKQCLSLTKDVEKALGEVSERQKTKEFYSKEAEKGRLTN